MKIYLDDTRPAPNGWVLARWPEEVIGMLRSGGVTHVSLDHDLGDDTHGTGYDVIEWIEREVATSNFQPPLINIHTANPSAYVRMALGCAAIDRLIAAREQENLE